MFITKLPKNIPVYNMRGEKLDPTDSKKARILLKEKKARILSRTPFTIQLTIATGETRSHNAGK